MDGSGQYRPSSRHFQSNAPPQLPPPSQLQLHHSAFSRSNTLPPINLIQQQQQQHHQQQQHQQQQQQQQQRSSYPSSSSSSYTNQLPPLPSPSSSSWGHHHHRTSSSRDELHPSHHQSLHSLPPPPPPPPLPRSDTSRKDINVKRETVPAQMHPLPKQQQQQQSQSQASRQPPPPAKEQEDAMPATSDFVKKLFKMLEDPSFSHTVSWAPGGDSFVVKDMNEFTKSILPRMFKHSNFASFVRQLNKYDFHKVKNTDDNQFGEHSWTFRHPDFHAERRDALENIKRKVPTQRKSTTAAATPTSASASASAPAPAAATTPTSPTSTSQTAQLNLPPPPLSLSHQSQTQQTQTQILTLQSQIDTLKQTLSTQSTHILSLERNYQDVLVEMVQFQRNMAQQDGLMQNLIQYFLGVENGKVKQEAMNNNLPGPSSRSSSSSSGGAGGVGASTSTTAAVGVGSDSSAAGGSTATGTAASAPAPAPSTTNTTTTTTTPHTSTSPHPHPPKPTQSASAASASSPTPTPTPLSSGPLTNPFLPTEEAQRMIGGSYAESDVARASLVQMNEISRRAEVAGMSFVGVGSVGGVGTGGGVGGGGGGLKMMADAAGLVGASEGDTKAVLGGVMGLGDGGGGMPLITSRQDALARIEELHRSRPTSAQGQGNGNNRDVTFGVNGTYQLPFDGGDNTWAAGGEGTVSDPNANGSTTNGVTGVGAGTNTNTGAGPSDVSGTSAADADGLLAPGGDPTAAHQGLRVFTMGHLMPRSAHDDGNGNWSFDPGSLGLGGGLPPAIGGLLPDVGGYAGSGSGSGQGVGGGSRQSSGGTTGPAEAGSSTGPGTGLSTPASTTAGVPSRPTTAQKLRVRRSTFVPGWAVPPRVLLVDDDEVNRRMSSKFLQVFGCTIDVAVDGVGAVERMNLEKYDLVLMDIVMPKLDGISATSMIRQFDHMTPIISMTSNSKPNEIMTYYSSGMNDILPKPFTQDGLLDMLEKHLMHLKVIQQMAQIPRSVGIPPLSDSAFEQALAVGASNNSLMAAGGSDETDNRINPLAGMGLTDEQYTLILQNMVNSESFAGVPIPNDIAGGGPSVNGVKRGLEEDEDERDGKRGRFEVVE